MVDLATSRVGGEIVWCNDEFFAPVANLISPADPVWKEGEFTDHGKWMDGWETRRRRDEGYDSCVVRLGVPGIVNSVTVDTAFFTGNYPESFSLEACGVPTQRLDGAEWVEIIPRTQLNGDSQATFDVAADDRVTHLRLNIYPDGGVARLRVDGEPLPGIELVCPDAGYVDLASALVGGRGTAASDSHYSSPANLVSPTEPEGMWDGWETSRRRGPGHDWAVVELGLPGTVHAVDVDTRHFKGNAPGWVTLDTALGDDEWSEVCGRTPVEAHAVSHIELPEPVRADRVRLNIHPDGGVARLRVWGRPDRKAAAAIRLRYLNALYPQAARGFFLTACGAHAWVQRMIAERPFTDVDRLLTAAGHAFDGLGEADWRQAFAAHPRIGESEGRQDKAGAAFSAGEQAGMTDADRSLRAEMAELNRAYEARFGLTYIVRAAGRGGGEMLDILRRRLDNDPAAELTEAAEQQRQISMGRLRKMLCSPEEDT